MYSIDDNVVLDNMNISDVTSIIHESKKKAPRIILGKHVIALNKGLYDNFEVLTSKSLLGTLNDIISEAGNIYVLGQIASEKFNEDILDYSESVISGIVNSVMTVLMERLSKNPNYSGSLLELFEKQN